MPYRPLESNITKNILKYLRSLKDCFAWKVHGGMYGTAGIPDVVVCYRGRFLAFEVKRPGNKPTKLQAATIKKMRQAGGDVHVVTSVGEVKEVMRATTRDTAGAATTTTGATG
jgi:Holliday junction resolvase